MSPARDLISSDPLLLCLLFFFSSLWSLWSLSLSIKPEIRFVSLQDSIGEHMLTQREDYERLRRSPRMSMPQFPEDDSMPAASLAAAKWPDIET